MHNNVYRAFLAAPREGEVCDSTSATIDMLMRQLKARRALLPLLAFNSFAKDFETPEVSEGFSEVKTVNWVFRGTEEDRLRWTVRTYGFRKH